MGKDEFLETERMIRSITIATPELGDHTSLIHDGEVAAVIDPQRDVERVLVAAAEAGVRIACVAETHVHNDYVSGGRALADSLGVPYLVAAGETVSFSRQAVHDGDLVMVGRDFGLRVMATPGHTHHHVSYIAEEFGRPVKVATGGSLLFETTGRTDLSGAGHTHDLARAQYHSAHRLATLPDDVELLPTHGFGSFCAPRPASAGDIPAHSTIGEQRHANLAFVVPDEETFVRELLAALIDYPSYYHHMADINRQGPALPSPEEVSSLALDGPGLRRALDEGAWVVDLRDRIAFAAGHLAGTVNIGHAASFSTWLGWLVPWGAPLVLAAEYPEILDAARRDLSRIGIDQLTGHYLGPLPHVHEGPQVRHYPVAHRADLLVARHVPGTVVLDVRRSDEWDAWHLDGAIHIPLPELVERIPELPAGTVWVHCAAGYRAAIASSLLERAGRATVLVDGSVAAGTVAA
jgi:glyoxylase-like metal-dependent hydrolase (beta-lactamase superfamily II)/rhodanese-related sulfurtransferase